MKSATPRNNNKTERRPTCKNPACKARFRTTNATAIYCSRPCKERAAALKKRVNYVDRASDSAFMFMLASECHRAQTLQILEGHTVESLVELYTVYKYWLRANQYGSVSDFALSHISPVAGNRTIGRFHAHNIVVAPTHMNRSHGTKHFGHGLSVSRASLQDRHAVDKHEPRKTTVARIIRFLGEDIVSEFARIAKVQPTGRHKVMSWLMDHLDATIPEHVEHLERLHKLSTKALTMLKAEIEGKEPITPYRAPVKEAQTLEVFAHELSRHAELRLELKPLATFILECSKHINPQELLVIPLEFFQALFNVLHGKALADVAEDLAPALATLQALAGLSGELPEVSAPMDKTPAAEAPVKVLATLTGFVESLDEAVPEVIPFRPLTPSPVAQEPLPWEV